MQPSCSEALHITVRNGSSVSRNSLTMNVGAGSSSQVLEGDELMILLSSGLVQAVNVDSSSQLVSRKVGAGEPAVSRLTESTLSSKNRRKSAAANDEVDGAWPVDLPRRVETDCQSFLGFVDAAAILCSQKVFSLSRNRKCLSRAALIQARRSAGSLVRRNRFSSRRTSRLIVLHSSSNQGVIHTYYAYVLRTNT